MTVHAPKVKKINAISPVWIVPIVALAIALWLAVQEKFEQGELIEITFSQAAEIIPGETQIRLNDVPVGIVKSVSLADDLKSVVVKARMKPVLTSHLTDNARFWVVTPRISTTGISNLGTLISGIYIVMDPGLDEEMSKGQDNSQNAQKGKRINTFAGLNEPPLFQSDEEGTRYVLQAEELGSLDISSPIYYRQIRVGEVIAYRLSEENSQVNVSIFIRAPYDKLVKSKSRFWNVSGFGFSLGAEGVKVNMSSLASLIGGGVAFDNVAAMGELDQAKEDKPFYLYADRDSVLEGRFHIKYFYRLNFRGSARGLTVGAPVELRGIKVGEVVDVVLNDPDNKNDQLEVFIAMEPQRFQSDSAPTRIEVDDRFEKMVEQGLRAKMKTASLVTGSRFIDLTFDDATPGKFIRGEKYSEIPTVYESTDKIAMQASDLMAKVGQIPIIEISENLSSSLANLNQILSDITQQNTISKVNTTIDGVGSTLSQASMALEQLDSTMKSLDLAVAPDSETRYELNETLKKTGEAAYALRSLIEELKRKPNAVITGYGKDK